MKKEDISIKALLNDTQLAYIATVSIIILSNVVGIAFLIKFMLG